MVTSVLLTFEEHPIARMMLKQLIEHELGPCTVVQERSGFGARKAALYQPLLEGRSDLPTIEQTCLVRDITQILVPNINEQTVIEAISKIKPDLILLGNTRIIKPAVFSLAKGGCINIHPGLLPEIKGAFPQVWSILNDEAIGCTCHLIDEDVDTGPIIFRQAIEPCSGDDLDALMLKTMHLSAELMVRAVASYRQHGRFDLIKVPPGGCYYGIPEPEIVAKARWKLAQGLYQPLTSKRAVDTELEC